ncbi:hypothetical protein [Pseudomonas syringae]|uniref:hypothetical protein n=1 Tax=Pseudomonas syringae TaxID=317 RepID=UPI000CDA8341|nr:hypothetical protein [Pseudomonas syringae]POP79314.1 hypothetical protein CXB37_04195 [Pseudomonas syringae pv. syringae]
MRISTVLSRILLVRFGVFLAPQWMYLPSKGYVGGVNSFGVALKETRPGWRHAGLVTYDSKLKTLRLLHLADHYCFENSPVTPDYILFPNNNFNLGEIEYLSERALRLWEANGNAIAYGLDYDGSPAFDANMKFMGAGGRGLTCATFVLAFMARCGFAVADPASWNARSDDKKFQEVIFNYLAPHLTAEQRARMGAAVGNAARFRPEEVVACFSHYDTVPFRFIPAQLWGREVLRETNMT